MLLVLRQILLAAVGERRVIVGKTEVYERLAVYRQGDEATYQRNLNSAWNQMVNKFRVLHELDDGRRIGYAIAARDVEINFRRCKA